VTLANSLGGLKGVLIAVGGILAAPYLSPAIRLAAQAFGAFASAVGGAPLGILAGIAGAGVAIYRDWGNVSAALSRVGEAFGEVFNAGSFSQFVTAMNNVGTAVDNVGLAIWDALLRGVLDVIQLVFGEGARGHVEGFLTFLDSIPARIGTALSGVGASIAMAWADVDARWQEGTATIRQAVSDFASWLGTAAMEAIRSAVSGIADAITAPFRSAADYIKGLTGSGIFNGPTPSHVGAGVSRGGLIPRGPTAAPVAPPAAPGKQSSLIERATKAGAVGGGPQQVAMTGGATLEVNIQAADGLKVGGTETKSEGLISRVNLNRGPSMATG
jgi:hypothetical protein